MSSSNNTPESELASIRQELNELRQTIGAMRGNGHHNTNGTSVLASAESTALTDRRGMMKKMAGLAVGVAAVGLLRPSRSSAAGYSKESNVPAVTGGNFILGQINSATDTDSTDLINPAFVVAPTQFRVDNYGSTSSALLDPPAGNFTAGLFHIDNLGSTPTTGTFYALYAVANAQAGGVAHGMFVQGESRGIVARGGNGQEGVNAFCDGGTNAWGVYGASDIGVGGAFSGGRCALYLIEGSFSVPNPNVTEPTGSGEGDVYRGSTNGSLWYRTSAATNPYRRLADATTAGALSLLASPVRFIDTRPGGTGDPGGAYTNGAVRQYNFVTLQPGTIPAGVRGIVGNIVAVSPSSTGNLAISATGVFDTAVLNFNTNQDIGNHFVAAVDANGVLQVKATVNGAGANLHLVIDIYGYYL